MAFIINKFPFPSTSNHVDFSGLVFDSSVRRAYATSQYGQRAILWTNQVDINDLLNKKYDVIFADNLTAEDVRRLKDNGSRVFLTFSLVTANINKPYSSSLFDRFTGDPIAAFVKNQYKIGSFFTEFWNPNWKDILLNSVENLISKNADGILVRETDLYHYVQGSDLYNKMVSLFESVADKIRIAKQKVFIETQEFIDNLYVMTKVKGVVFPFYFIDNNFQRRSLTTRLEYQQKLVDLRKEIFISDPSETIGQRKEFLNRVSSRSFIPVLKTRDEDSIIDPLDKKRVTHVDLFQNVWKASVNDIKKGDTKVQFFSGVQLLNSALIRFSLIKWPEILSLPSNYSYFTDSSCENSFPVSSCSDGLPLAECNFQLNSFIAPTSCSEYIPPEEEPKELSVCDFYLPNRVLKKINAENEKKLLFEIRSFGLRSLGLDNIAKLEVLVSEWNSRFSNEWLSVKELVKILDTFTYPLTIRRTNSGARVSSETGNSIDIDSISCGAEHNAILVQMYYNNSPVFLVIGDKFSLKCFGFILENMDKYSEILNDESVFLITASTMLLNHCDYFPDENNVSIVPLIEKLNFE